MGNFFGSRKREDEIKRKNLKREFNKEKVESLVCKYEQLRFKADLGEENPQILRRKLNRVTIDLTKLLVSEDLSPERRREVIKEVKKGSFEDFYSSKMYGSSDFDQDMFETAHQTGDAERLEVENRLVIIGALMNKVEIKTARDLRLR